MIVDTCSPTETMINLKYSLLDDSKHKTRVHQLDFIGAFLQSNVKHRCFLNLGRRYGEYFPEYFNYFVRPLGIKTPTYDMNNSGNLISNELTNWLIDESNFKQSQCQMYLYYKYAPYG